MVFFGLTLTSIEAHAAESILVKDRTVTRFKVHPYAGEKGKVYVWFAPTFLNSKSEPLCGQYSDMMVIEFNRPLAKEVYAAVMMAISTQSKVSVLVDTYFCSINDASPLTQITVKAR